MKNNRTEKSARIDDPASWVDTYGDFLYRFALFRVKVPPVAEDLVQETFLAALKSRYNFQGRSSTRTWLIAILKHKIVDHIRKRIREQASDKVEALSDAAAQDIIDGDFQNRRGLAPPPFQVACQSDEGLRTERVYGCPLQLFGGFTETPGRYVYDA